MTETMTEPRPPARGQSANDSGGYVVLELDGSGLWTVTTKIDARTADAAIRAYVGKAPSDGTFVAVPARSWRPVKVTPKTTTTLVVEEVKP